MCDSALLAAHVFASGPGDVVATLRAVAATDPDAYLNVLMTDGEQIVGVTWGDELSYLVEPDGVVVASEPWDDDPRWIDVPDRHLIRGDLGRGHRHRSGAHLTWMSTSIPARWPTSWPPMCGPA